MKLSNKILIGFFSVILLYILASFAEIRLTGVRNDLKSENIIKESSPISNIKYLVVHEMDENLHIEMSNESKIEIRSVKGGLMQSLDYSVSGDTLVLNSFKVNEGVSAGVTLYIPGNTLNTLKVLNGNVVLDRLVQPQLTIEQVGGHISAWGHVELAKLNATASKEAQFNSSRSLKVDTVSLYLNNANYRVWASMKQLDANINNRSELTVRATNDIRLKKTDDSELRIYN